MSNIVFTLDLEDHRPDEFVEPRFRAVTDELLLDLDEWGVTGTVFVVGEVARDDPDLVARVAARGHGPLTVPLLGGTYLRAAPRPIIGWAAKRAPEHAWLYAHPYDFDPDEPRWVVPEVGRLGSRVLWWGRSAMKTRVGQLVAGSRQTLADMASSMPELPVFGPPVNKLETGSGQ